MANTGNKIFSTLVQYIVGTNISTGLTKPNDISDPDYVHPILDTINCPTTTTTTTTPPTPQACSILPSSRILCQSISKYEEFSLGTSNGLVTVNYSVSKVYGSGVSSIELIYGGVQQDVINLLVQGDNGSLSFNYIYNGSSDLLTIHFHTAAPATSITTIVNCPI